MGTATALYTLILEDFWTKVDLILYLEFPVLEKNFATCWISYYIFIENVTTKIFQVFFNCNNLLYSDFASYWVLS